MKKYLLLLAAFGIFLFASCSDEDDDNGGEMSIIATWTLESISPSQVYDLSACENKPTITFNQDNSTDWTFYDSENNCQAVESSGDWSKNSDSSYTVDIPDLGTFTGNVEFFGPDKFTFTASYGGFPVVLTFQK